ncbi:CRIB domain-containing protein [Nymphaea thermarum]|nr:CRIB domain-containing protein [Nymphaea thermarum]
MSVESKIPNSVALRHLDATPAAVTDSAASQQEPNCKEHEMEIGYPTDVKHVAHIGWDGASVNTPSWMKKFGTASDLPSSPFTLPGAENESTGAVSSLQGLRCTTADVQDKASRGTPGTPKQSRRHQSSGNAAAPAADPSKPTRRHLSNGEPSDAPSAEPSEATKPSRRRLTVGSNESDSFTRDSPKVPKNPRPRRPKGDGSTRSSSRASKLKAASSASTEDDSAKPSEEDQLT